MKAIYLHAAGAIALTFTLAACASNAVPNVAVPEPAPVATPSPAPAPVVAPPAPISLSIDPADYTDFADKPHTPGTWFYSQTSADSRAVFGTSARDAVFMMRCDKATRRISLNRPTTLRGQQKMRVDTETASLEFNANTLGEGSILAAEFAATDPILDAMAITKGRFAITSPRATPLYIPAWVEVSRVIEDCR